MLCRMIDRPRTARFRPRKMPPTWRDITFVLRHVLDDPNAAEIIQLTPVDITQGQINRECIGRHVCPQPVADRVDCAVEYHVPVTVPNLLRCHIRDERFRPDHDLELRLFAEFAPMKCLHAPGEVLEPIAPIRHRNTPFGQKIDFNHLDTVYRVGAAVGVESSPR